MIDRRRNAKPPRYIRECRSLLGREELSHIIWNASNNIRSSSRGSICHLLNLNSSCKGLLFHDEMAGVSHDDNRPTDGANPFYETAFPCTQVRDAIPPLQPKRLIWRHLSQRPSGLLDCIRTLQDSVRVIERENHGNSMDVVEQRTLLRGTGLSNPVRVNVVL